MRRSSFLFFAALALLPVPVLAAGKAGLWQVTTTYQFGMRFVPPALVSLARAQGLKPPVSGQPFTHHMCMTSYEMQGDQPLHFNSRDLDCTDRVVSFAASRMVLESICHGPLEGVEGILVRDSSGDRLVVSINLLNRGASLHISHDQVCPVGKDS